MKKNLIKNDYSANNSQEKWVIDIKYISTYEGNIYLNIIRDVYSQAIISYKICEKMDYQTLVKPCLENALKLFNFKVNNLILHTDNGIRTLAILLTNIKFFYIIKLINRTYCRLS